MGSSCSPTPILLAEREIGHVITVTHVRFISSPCCFIQHRSTTKKCLCELQERQWEMQKPVKATVMGRVFAIRSQWNPLEFSETWGRQAPGMSGERHQSLHATPKVPCSSPITRLSLLPPFQVTDALDIQIPIELGHFSDGIALCTAGRLCDLRVTMGPENRRQ